MTPSLMPPAIDGLRRWCGGLVALVGVSTALLLVYGAFQMVFQDRATRPDDGFCTLAVSRSEIPSATVRFGLVGTAEGMASVFAQVVPDPPSCAAGAIPALFDASVNDREWFMPFYLLTFFAVAAWLATSGPAVRRGRRYTIVAISLAVIVMASLLLHADRQENDAVESALRQYSSHLADVARPAVEAAATDALRQASVAKWRLVSALLTTLAVGFALLGNHWRWCGATLLAAGLAVAWGAMLDRSAAQSAVRFIEAGFLLMAITLMLFAVLWIRERLRARKANSMPAS